eukprot:scaffold107933_cov63-Phaeocystis_antarctica.AAC.5
MLLCYHAITILSAGSSPATIPQAVPSGSSPATILPTILSGSSPAMRWPRRAQSRAAGPGRSLKA